MIEPRQITSQLLGAIDWQTEVSGFCRCPGEALHTSGNGKKDCRVNVDGAPTIFCFHASCIAVVAEANRRLGREMGDGRWEIVLPGGRPLRSGDVLRKAHGFFWPWEEIFREAEKRTAVNQKQIIMRDRFG